MIRRNPTLIPMTDLDVQDIRNMVAKQKEQALLQQQALQKIKRMAESPNIEQGDIQFLKHVKAREEKDRRLGLS